MLPRMFLAVDRNSPREFFFVLGTGLRAVFKEKSWKQICKVVHIYVNAPKWNNLSPLCLNFRIEVCTRQSWKGFILVPLPSEIVKQVKEIMSPCIFSLSGFQLRPFFITPYQTKISIGKTCVTKRFVPIFFRWKRLLGRAPTPNVLSKWNNSGIPEKYLFWCAFPRKDGNSTFSLQIW